MRRTQLVAVVFVQVAMSVALVQQASGADRSQAGHQASAMTVPPRPTPTIPEGNMGLAAKYPGDVGIEKDPDVVFVGRSTRGDRRRENCSRRLST